MYIAKKLCHRFSRKNITFDTGYADWCRDRKAIKNRFCEIMSTAESICFVLYIADHFANLFECFDMYRIDGFAMFSIKWSLERWNNLELMAPFFKITKRSKQGLKNNVYFSRR